MVHAVHDDARHLMLTSENVYDVIDLDPYGSPCQLLDTALCAINNGGLLAVTCTDMAVLCGNEVRACWSKYRSVSHHKTYWHEQALRILLYTIDTAACRLGKNIEPVISMSIDFYIRVFVRVFM